MIFPYSTHVFPTSPLLIFAPFPLLTCHYFPSTPPFCHFPFFYHFLYFPIYPFPLIFVISSTSFLLITSHLPLIFPKFPPIVCPPIISSHSFLVYPTFPALISLYFPFSLPLIFHHFPHFPASHFSSLHFPIPNFLSRFLLPLPISAFFPITSLASPSIVYPHCLILPILSLS